MNTSVHFINEQYSIFCSDKGKSNSKKAVHALAHATQRDGIVKLFKPSYGDSCLGPKLPGFKINPSNAGAII